MIPYFAPVPSDQEGIVALVRREAQEECWDDQFPPLMLDSCVREAVESLRDSRLTTFAPFLALRRVRARIRAGTCDCDDW